MKKNPRHNKILIIDDDLLNCEIYYVYLKKAGFEPKISSNALEGLEQSKIFKPHLILLDVKMPHMDGFELCSELKNDEETKNIPVIFLTGLTDTKTMAKAFEVGGVDYIAKPVRRVELIARVTNHIQIFKYKNELETLVKQRTLELQQHRDQLEAMVIENIINNIPSVLISVDAECLITRWGGLAEQKTGISAQDAIGSKLDDALPDISSLMEDIKTAIKEHKVFRENTHFQNTQTPSALTVFPLNTEHSGGAVIKIDESIDKDLIESGQFILS